MEEKNYELEEYEELEEFELDEKLLKKIARKYRAKTFGAVITLIVTLIAAAFSLYVFYGNCELTSNLSNAEYFESRGNYIGAYSNYNVAGVKAENKNNLVPIFRQGNKAFMGKINSYDALYGPVECKKLIDTYYPNGNYPQELQVYINNERNFLQAYNELNVFVYNTAKDYAEAYEGIEKIAAENPEYPEYVVLYFHLLATQKFNESPASQLSAYNALSKAAPEKTWLYAQAGTKALIKNNELSKALRLCPDDASAESRALRVSIHRLMGEYNEAGMLYDEYRIFGITFESLDRERLIIYLMEGDVRTGLATMKQYTNNLENCKDVRTIYVLQIAAIKANNTALEKKLNDFVKKEKIPQSSEVSAYRLGDMDLTDIFLNGGSELN